jgi:hypothetical protein
MAAGFRIFACGSLKAVSEADGSFTIQFGGCQKETPDCLPIMAGWDCIAILYRPRKEIIDATWKFPEAQPVN